MTSIKNIKFLGMTIAYVNKTGTNSPVIKTVQEASRSRLGNFLVCPLSAEIALALAQTGAQGTTSSQISDALHIPHNPIRIQLAFQDLYRNFQVDKEYNLNCINKIYVKDGIELNPEFEKTSLGVFKAQIQHVNFLKQNEAVAEINKWLEEKTYIKDFVNKERLHADTRIVFVNVIYFHGRPVKAFKVAKNKRPFFLNKSDFVDTEMLETMDHFNYVENPKLKIKTLELPFDGQDISLTFILPEQKEGLSDLENHIAECFLPPDYKVQPVHVQFPKCVMTNSIHFNDVLRGLGVTDAFEDKADFTKIFRNEDRVKIGTIMHQTFVEILDTPSMKSGGGIVDSRGSSDSLLKPLNFVADHPFIFYLRHKLTGIFFMGRMYTPQGQVKSIKTEVPRKQ